ncbi:class I SAM-dependent methyltransferase [Clostridia bacterium OttesenSCG-928-F22]|nr:class I SAM-dependent methyltransferase [Clostridia bacterium OttesenSCG-928-F22]
MERDVILNARKPMGEHGNTMIESMNSNHLEMTVWALDGLAIKREDSVLDIGCGGGRAVSLLAERAQHVTGIDYSPLCVESAKEMNRQYLAEGKVEILEASVSSLPLENACFDFVTAIETIYFWPDIVHDFSEVHRVLLPGGAFCIVCEMFRQEGRPANFLEYVDILQMYLPSEDELRDYLTQAGFERITVKIEQEKQWLLIMGYKA